MSEVDNLFLLSRLRDLRQCDEELAMLVRQTVLEPFQPDLSEIRSNKRAGRPSRQQFQEMATRLGRLQLEIVNQNTRTLQSLRTRSREERADNQIAIKCLLDSALYCLSGLKHTKVYMRLGPLDIEKSAANLVSKMVDLGQYTRALDELIRLRSNLASSINLQLDKVQAYESLFDEKSPTPPSSPRRFLTASPNRKQSTDCLSKANAAHKIFRSDTANIPPTDAHLLRKYADLLIYPFDTSINDPYVILLIISFQTNTIRCLIEINNGNLLKYLYPLLNRRGNIMDWCLHLQSIDPSQARSQLNNTYRALSKAASMLPQTDNAALHSFALQCLAIQASYYGGTTTKQSLCDRIVRMGLAYENSSTQVDYPTLQEICYNIAKTVEPSVSNLAELDAYFNLCEYCAYVARKSKGLLATINAIQQTVMIIENMEEDERTKSYYLTTQLAAARLAMAATQLERVVLGDSYNGVQSNLSDTLSILQNLSEIVDHARSKDRYSDQATSNFCKSVDIFRSSCSRFYESIEKKKKLNKEIAGNLPPDAVIQSEEWEIALERIKLCLYTCTEILPCMIQTMQKRTWTSQSKTLQSADEAMLTFVDILVLLSRMMFDVDDEDSYSQSYDYLSFAEQVCADVGYSGGYRWLSNAYYMIGGLLFRAGHCEAANYPFRKSCALLEKDTERVATDTGKLQLCKRYEALGVSNQASKYFEDAAKAYRLALKRLPRSNIKAFVRDHNKLSVYGLIEKNPFVPKLIERFLRASIVDDDMPQVDFAHDMMDLDDLQPSEKCIIYECELKVLQNLSSKYDCNRQQVVLVSALLRNYDSLEYPLRRARVLLGRVRIELSVKGSRELAVSRAIEAATEASTLLQSESYGQDSALLQYRQHYLALALSWRALCAKEQGGNMTKSLNLALQHWGMLLKNLRPIYTGAPRKETLQQLYTQVDDLDRLYDHLRMLADFFGINSQLIYQISTLRLMLKLNNGLRSATSDHITDSVLISSQIGRIYSDLGYSGKASMEFSQAGNIIPTGKVSVEAHITYLVLYARHLAKIGNLEKGQTTFNAAQKLWKSLIQSSTDNSYKNSRSELSRRLILADAYLTRSFISMHTETLVAAVDDCAQSLSILTSCTRTVRQRIQALMNDRANHLQDPFQSEPASSAKQQTKGLALVSSLTFKDSEWLIAQKTSTCLQQLAYLYMTRGSWRDTKYYLEKGYELAEQMKADLTKFNFLLSLSNFHLRTGSIEDSRRDLETAMCLLPQGYCYLQEEAKFKMAVGDVDARQNCIDDALQSFDRAHELLTKVMDRGYIASIENLVESQDAQDTVSDASQLLSMEKRSRNDNQFECRPLRNIQALNTIRKALMLVANDSVAEGLALLEKLEESIASILDELELNAAISKSRAHSIKRDLADNVLFSEAHILPSFPAKQTKPSIVKKTSNSQHLRLLRDNLNFAMERMLETHRIGAEKAPIHLLHQLCLDSGSMMFLKNFFASSGRILMNNYAALSTYYLEMSKGLSIRREMQRCLIDKLQLRANTQSTEMQWPKTFSEEIEESVNEPVDMDIDEESDWLAAHLTSLNAAYTEEHELDDKEFQEKFVDILPDNWTVCSITMDTSTNHMCIGRLRSGQTPLVVKVPLQRGAHRALQMETASLEEVINDLNDIIHQSDDTIKNSDMYARERNAGQWWQIRTQLDRRLRRLLELVEEKWFGGFKGLLVGRYYEDEDELVRFQETVGNLLFEAVSKHGKQKVNKRLDLDLEVCRMVLRLGPDAQDFELVDIVYFLLASHEIHDISLDYNAIDPTKLVSKLKAAITSYHCNAQSAGVNTMQKLPDEHVILILDNHIHKLPLESMATLRSQAVSRLPCLSFLRDRILYLLASSQTEQNEDADWSHFSIDKRSTYYVLNPSGDLKKTQQEFEETFQNMNGWSGIVEQRPVEFHWISSVQRHQLYMYFGHNGGESMIRGKAVKRLRHCPVAILMGCSSGALHPRGEFDADGNVVNYLLAGSPAVAGNLWDVTDKSIDLLTKKMLEEWGILGKNKHISLDEAVSAARDHCVLPFLIGAATVVYGIPTYIK